MAIRGIVQALAASLLLALVGCNWADEVGPTGTDADTQAATSDTTGANDSDSTQSSAEPESPAGPELNVPPAAGGEELTLTNDNTTIQFVGTKDDGRHDGGFRELEGTVQRNGESVEALSVTVQTDSLWADNPKLEGHLKNPDFFEVQAHPELSFVSTSIREGGSGATHTITGDLTMLDQTHSIDIPATIEVSGDKVNLTSEFTIDRTRWGMDYRPEQVHKDVQISVTIEATR